MFTVGEFSKIAQVSTRLLRYYDELGLFVPAQIDTFTGRRFYSADQMPALNRILALKDLGLSLEQIRDLLHAQVSAEALQGMLLLKKAELETQIQAEMHRIRRIESRLQAIRDVEENRPPNVVIKQMPRQPVLSTRLTAVTFETALSTMQRIRQRLPENKTYGFCFVICDDETDALDNLHLEIGCFVEGDAHPAVTVSGSLQLTYRQLPAVETVATSIVQGPLERILLGYAQIGNWAEHNGYQTVGQPREITLQLPQTATGDDLITEVRYPVEPVPLA